ncbi:MAG: EAL domain-containing protein, partial [Actinomycetota bacterium]|nr:EAL domain-containing protein [Actinomycetota bacterium]
LQEITYTPGRGLAVLFIDLDQFKFINDTLGHAAGDQFLKAVADRLKACTGPRDSVARIGGDEFLLLCPTITRRRQAELLGRRIVTSLQQPLAIYGRSVSLSVSVGIAMHSPKAGPLTSDLVGDADLAMYAAKRSGRNSVAVFNDELRQRAAGRLSLEGDLSQALANDEMACAYQPIVDLRTGELLAVEALLRWNSPTRGQLPPRSFIPTAEDSGLIFGLGEFVLRTACTQLAAWRADNKAWHNVSMKINVSPRQLRDSAFADLTEQVLASTRLPARTLGLEVTETTFIVDPLVARNTLTRLRSRGIQVAIDDFGTGYSSLAQLKDLPTDVLKIDRQFITDINTDAEAAGIADAIITLARTLGLGVIAEGVETETQRRQLIELGCLHGQGYLWSAAVGPDELVGLLRTDSSGSGGTRFTLDQLSPADAAG